jgi:CubicO group peptidase (beta-lactamase class C family)
MTAAASTIVAQSVSSNAQPQSDPTLRAFVQSLVDRHLIAGGVAVIATKDKVLVTESVGYADLAAKKPIAPGDEFWIASMSKAMTASALMMLVDEGKVHLDDPVEKYLPEFKGQMVRVYRPGDKANPGPEPGPLEPAKHPITVREIMSHSAGLPFQSAKEPHQLDRLPLAEAVKSYAAEPLMYQPGTGYTYSNEGLNTAGRIVEVVSGMPYEQFLQTRLFDPLGMKNTTFWPNAEQIARLPKSYKTNPAGDGMEVAAITQLTLPLDDREHRFPMPAGGLFSTADDVVHFCQMLMNGGTFQGKKILSEAAVREMSSNQDKQIKGASYGFGLNVNGTGKKFGHGGAYKTEMRMNTDTGSIVIFMVQKADRYPDGPDPREALEAEADRFVKSSH